MEDQDTMITVRVSVRNKIKSLAAIQGKTMTALVDEVLMEYIMKQEAA
jgi:hypothetical protein